MGTKNTKTEEEKIIPIPEELVKGKGEGIKPPIIPVIEKKEYHEEKKPSGWQKKFLGIPVWGWVVIGLVLVWAGIIVGIVAYR